MASKQVIDRQKQAKLVLATGETHASALTTRLTSELSPHLQRGEKLPDVALLAQLFLRWLGQAETDLVSARPAYEGGPPRGAVGGPLRCPVWRSSGETARDDRRDPD